MLEAFLQFAQYTIYDIWLSLWLQYMTDMFVCYLVFLGVVVLWAVSLEKSFDW